MKERDFKMTYGEIWDKFTDLSPEEMADIAERAGNGTLYIFKVKDFNEGFKRARESEYFPFDEDYAGFTEMIWEAASTGLVDRTLLNNEEAWCRLDLDSDCFGIFFDIMDFLTDYEDTIIDGIFDDEDLQMEVLGEFLEEDIEDDYE